MMGRKGVAGRGQRKIEIKKIQSKDARHVCFSKRKSGIFAKASDISTLCGAGVAVLVYSPAGAASGEGRSNVIQKLNQQYMEVSTQLDAARARKDKLHERLSGSLVQSQEIEWAKNIDSLGLEQLDRLREGLERLKSKADARINEILGGDGSGQRMPSPSVGGLGINPAGVEASPSSSLTIIGFTSMQFAANELDCFDHSTSSPNVGWYQHVHGADHIA